MPAVPNSSVRLRLSRWLVQGLSSVASVGTAQQANPIRRWSGVGLIAAAVGWTAFVLATLGSAEESYFRDCTGSCLAEMPDSYRFEHALLGIAFIVVPVALAAGAWFLFGWLFSSADD